MSMFSQLSPGARRNVLAVVMLALLVLATGAASLTAYAMKKPPLPGEQWYLIYDAEGEPLAWRSRRHDDRNAWILGHEIFGAAGNSPPVAEVYRLRADERASEYAAVAPEQVRPRRWENVVTRIEYAEGTIRIVRTLAGENVGEARRLRAPQDYIPEGALRGRIVRVGRTGNPSAGQMVINDAMALRPVKITPDGVETVTGAEGPVEVRMVQVDIAGQPSARYGVDQTGRIVVEETLRNGQVYRRALLSSAETVAEHFPTAQSKRARALRLLED